jgi:hypothetical protein
MSTSSWPASLNLTFAIDQNLLGLDISMDNKLDVGKLERIAHQGDGRESLPRRDGRSAARSGQGERLADPRRASIVCPPMSRLSFNLIAGRSWHSPKSIAHHDDRE